MAHSSDEPIAVGEPDDDGNDDLVEEAPRVPLRTVFTRFWPQTRSFRGRMVASLLLTGAVPALTTASLYLYKVLVDDVLTPHDFRLFIPVAALYLGITVVQGVVTWIDEFLTAWVGERFVMNLRVDLFTHMQRLSLGFFERRQLGDLLSRLGGDVAAIESLVLTGVNMALTYAFQVVFFAGMLFYLDWRLALAALVAAPGFLAVARGLSGRIQAAARDLRRRSGSIGAVAEESLSNLALVQAYDRQGDETARYRKENLGAFSAQMVAIRLEALFGPLSDLVELIGVLAVMGFAVYELANGQITLGGLLVFVAYLSQLYGPVAGFGGLWNEMSSAKAGAERIIEILDQEPAVTDPTDPTPFGRAAGALALHRVTFTYPDTERPALSGIDIRIAPGERVAVVGASGAGKTTLTKLLLRFYDPDGGRVTLDGHDLRAMSLSDLRRNVAAVLQETLVFDGTIADNIRWGRPEATDADIERAARAADVHRFVQDLPDGYATRVGQRGRLLSGGQRQRLAIARAMIRDAPVLLLDEPTTGLDAESTERVLAPLRRLMTGRTTLIISHNLSTVTDVDRIVFLEDGHITAVGSHSELLTRSPGYARLYRLHHPDAVPQGRTDAPRAIARGHERTHTGAAGRATTPATSTVTPAARHLRGGTIRTTNGGARPARSAHPTPFPRPDTAPAVPTPRPAAARTALPTPAPRWFEPDATTTTRLRLPHVAPAPRKGPRHLAEVSAPVSHRPAGRHRAPEERPAPIPVTEELPADGPGTTSADAVATPLQRPEAAAEVVEARPRPGEPFETRPAEPEGAVAAPVRQPQGPVPADG
jgi:ATP-binding cassette, subfamily B, bacterial